MVDRDSVRTFAFVMALAGGLLILALGLLWISTWITGDEIYRNETDDNVAVVAVLMGLSAWTLGTTASGLMAFKLLRSSRIVHAGAMLVFIGHALLPIRGWGVFALVPGLVVLATLRSKPSWLSRSACGVMILGALGLVPLVVGRVDPSPASWPVTFALPITLIGVGCVLLGFRAWRALPL